MQLALIVGLATGILGTGLAWLLVRTDVPLARVWRVLAPLPLVFPSFVGAAAFLAGLAPDGVIRDASSSSATTRRDGSAASARRAWCSPRSPIPTCTCRLRPGWRGCRRRSRRARGCSATARRGCSSASCCRRIRSSILGGMLIVFLYSLSEFGAVQLLGYDTLTRVVYATRLLDRAQSFAAAALLMVLAVIAIAIERRLRGADHHRAPPAARRNRPVPLGGGGSPRCAVSLVCSLVVAGRAARLARAVGVARHQPRRRRSATFRDELADLGAPAWTTAWLGVVAASPPSWSCSRRRCSPAAIAAASRATNAPILGGFAVPGLVIALSLAFWALNVPLLRPLLPDHAAADHGLRRALRRAGDALHRGRRRLRSPDGCASRRGCSARRPCGGR